MYKLQSKRIKLYTISYLILFLIELIIYLFKKSNIYGMIYLLLSLVILFLLITISRNYNRYYSENRISKLIIVIILGIFTSYILGPIILKSMNIIDSSIEYSKNILIPKSILKPLIFILLIPFTKKEYKSEKIIKWFLHEIAFFSINTWFFNAFIV